MRRIEKSIESNQIKKTIESNQIGKKLSLIKSRIMSQIESKTVTRETDSDDDRDHGGVSDAEIGSPVMRRCDCGNRDSIGDSGTVYVDIDIYIDIDIEIYIDIDIDIDVYVYVVCP